MVWRLVGALVVAGGLVAWVMTADWWAPIATRISPHEAVLSSGAHVEAPGKSIIDENFSPRGYPVVGKAAGQSN